MESIIGIITICIVVGFIWAIYQERKDYNNGYCPICGNRLKHFDNDSQGGRGYVCRNCHYHTWVSYWFIDKHHNSKPVKKGGEG